jgi:hypothetical protein
MKTERCDNLFQDLFAPPRDDGEEGASPQLAAP